MKKLLSIFLCCVLVFSLTSCRSKSTDAPSSSTTLEKVNLTFWNVFDSTDTFKGQIQAYESKHPNVKISYRKFSNPKEYEDLLINEIAQGEGPDIFAIHNTWVDKHKKKISPFPIGKTTSPLNEQIFDETFFHVASQDLIRDGIIYAIPLYIDTLALYYNKQIFQDNIPNSDKPAETWEDIKSQSAQITKENNSIERFSVSGIAMGRSDNISQALNIFYTLLAEYGVQFFSEAQGKAVFASQQEVIEGAGTPFSPFEEALKLFSSFGNPAFKNYAWNDAITSFSENGKELYPFLQGKVGMIAGYSYLYDDLIQMRRQMKTVAESTIDESDIGVVEFPQILAFSESGKRDVVADYYPLTVSRNSAHADYAWDFIQSLASKESLADYYEKTKKPTSRKDLVDEQMVDPIYGVFARQASYAKSVFAKSPVDPNFVNEVMTKALDEAIQNKKRLSEIIRTAQDQINCQIEKQAKLGEVDVDCLAVGI